MSGFRFPTRKPKEITVKRDPTIKKFAEDLLTCLKRQKCNCPDLSDCDCTQVMDLDIDTIDGIKLNCGICLEDENTVLGFIAESSNILAEFGDSLLYYQYFEKSKNFLESPRDVYKFCKKLKNLIPKLRLQLTGRLEPKNAPKKELSVSSFFGNRKNIGLKSVGDCSVCYQKTRSFIDCKHYLCIRCMFSLRPNEDYEVFCPICREDITCCKNAFVEPRD